MPALIYVLRVPGNVVVGTSLVQIVGTMAVATVLHAVTNQAVDVFWPLVLMVGGVIGAQFGARIGQNLRGDQLRALLALLVLAVAAALPGRARAAAGRALFAQPAVTGAL